MYAVLGKGLWVVFVAAAAGLLRCHYGADWPNAVTAAALALLCIDQGRMAYVDLRNIGQVGLNDSRVRRFAWVTALTIMLELLGFYLAWRWLFLGAGLVIVSQLLFNTAAPVQLQPHTETPVAAVDLANRRGVLIANGAALSLILLGQWPPAQGVSALGLLGLVLAYLTIKYWPAVAALKTRSNTAETR